MNPNMHHQYTPSNILKLVLIIFFKYIKALSIICSKNNYFITFFFELREHKFHICTWNLHCTIYGIIIFNITQVIF
jgi:hypothetical protein